MPDPLSLQFLRTHPADAARVFESIPAKDAAPYLDALPPPDAALLIDRLSPILARRILEDLNPERFAEVAGFLSVDLLAVLLRRMDRGARRRFLALLPDRIAGPVGRVLKYAAGTVGSIMDPGAATVVDGISVATAIDQVRETPLLQRDRLYALDTQQRLTGIVDARRLLTAGQGDSIASIAQPVEFRLSPRASMESVESHAGWRVHPELPVVEQDGRLVGTLSRRELMAELRGEEAEEEPAGPVDAIFEVAETVWDTWAGMFFHDHGVEQKGVES